MHAFIVTGGTLEARSEWVNARLSKWQVGKFDIREIRPDEDSIGIAQVRDFMRSLSFAPAVGIIWKAQLLTPEAQQALLKTIEEPPGQTRIIIETSSTDVLLATIISRCQVTNLGSASKFSHQDLKDWQNTWESLTKLSPGRAMKIIDSVITSRQDCLSWLDCGLEVFRQSVDTQSAGIRELLKARIQLLANVTPKLVIDIFILNQFKN